MMLNAKATIRTIPTPRTIRLRFMKRLSIPKRLASRRFALLLGDGGDGINS
jgi:hypothetical protein